MFTNLTIALFPDSSNPLLQSSASTAVDCTTCVGCVTVFYLFYCYLYYIVMIARLFQLANKFFHISVNTESPEIYKSVSSIC